MFIHQSLRNRHSILLTIALCFAVLFESLLSSCEDGGSQQQQQHTLTFDANGGEGAMATISLKESEATTLPKCTYTKGSYVCIGWSTNKNATTADLPAGSSYSMASQDATLYAIWSTTPCIEFSSSAPFTLKTANGKKGWGEATSNKIEYSLDTISWNEWNGTEINSSTSGHLYLRGTGNGGITSGGGQPWVLTPALDKKISCTGNIETLLDYSKVLDGEHPTMASFCYGQMFKDCTALESAPALPATTLDIYCYNQMFEGCTALTTAPALPATTLADNCYQQMFSGCTSLNTLPALPATQMFSSCYDEMFNGCTNIKLAENNASGNYPNSYSLPSSGTGGSDASSWSNNMFAGTGGAFTSSPTINTTYYTSNEIITPAP